MTGSYDETTWASSGESWMEINQDLQESEGSRQDLAMTIK